MSRLVEKHQMVEKIVFVGDSGVGKTSLLRREVDSSFTEQFCCTIGVDFKIKRYQVGQISVKAQIWDTAGQERFRSIQRPYYRGSQAILLCFSLAERQSFDNLLHWVDEINKFDIKGQVYLVGCKSDLDTIVPTDEILTFAQAYNLSYVQTSAKEDIGVSDAFQRIIEETTQANLIKMAYQKEEDPKLEPVLGHQPATKKRCC